MIGSVLVGPTILSIALIPLEVMWPGVPRQPAFDVLVYDRKSLARRSYG